VGGGYRFKKKELKKGLTQSVGKKSGGVLVVGRKDRDWGGGGSGVLPGSRSFITTTQ